MALSVAILLGTTAAARAASPGLNGTSPTGAQRGTEVEVSFNGARMADAQEILFYEPGITVASLEPAADGNSVKAKLSIAPDCRLGIHQLRVRTGSGLSNLRTFSVGALPEVAEAEPNSEFDKPQKIELGTVVNGVAENEDVDYYAVEAKKGDRITAEIEGLRLGITFFDPYVAILDAKRFELARSDDAPLRAAGLHRQRDRARRWNLPRRSPRNFVRRQRLVPVPAARGTFPAAHGRAPVWRQAG